MALATTELGRMVTSHLYIQAFPRDFMAQDVRLQGTLPGAMGRTQGLLAPGCHGCPQTVSRTCLQDSVQSTWIGWYRGSFPDFPGV